MDGRVCALLTYLAHNLHALFSDVEFYILTCLTVIYLRGNCQEVSLKLIINNESVGISILSAVKMADAKSLDEALEKLTTFLASKADGPTSGAIVPQEEVVQKLMLVPTGLKLEGTVGEPGDKTSAERKKWKAINSLLIGWLLNSVVPSLGRSVEGLSTVAEIWKTLSTKYSGKGNVMLIAQTYGKIRRLRQACIESGQKRITRRRVLQLVEGLDNRFDGRKASLLHHTSLPTIDEAIAAMTQEEVRLSLEQADEKTVPASTFVTAEPREWKETRDCFTCGEVGHLKWNCPTRGRGT
uniref:Uncharacterized protein n=1 Tax=Avena sativa TaxID=4498 RepID=A0ACD5WZJ0_AVESA